MTVIQKIAQTLEAWNNCNNSGNQEWLSKHEETLNSLVKNYLPSGSGFDAGVQLDFSRSDSSRIIFQTSFHHMNGAGYYTRWTEHDITVKPKFNGISIKVSGINYKEIKEYIAEIFNQVLTETYEI